MFIYPEVHRGDEIDFAPTEDTPEARWAFGTVIRTKTDSVDVKVNDRTYLDVRHIGDPFLEKRPVRNDTGVFRLAHRQLKFNRMVSEYEAMKRRMDALEQTFRAVMESQSSDSIPSPSPAVRRPGRPPLNQTINATSASM